MQTIATVTRESTYDLPLDPARPIFFPKFRLEERDGVFVLIDPENANWVGVNRAGYDLVRAVEGRSLMDLFPSGEDETARGKAQKFLDRLQRQEFVSNREIVYPRYNGRSDRLKLDRLHEFWIVPWYFCNLRCEHCYTIDQVVHNRHFLPAQTVKDIVDEAKALGTEVFYITGGEPLIRKDLPELVRHIATDRKCILFTNGTLVTEELAKEFSAVRDRLIVQVSIEGHSEERNAPLREEGSFEKALQGIRIFLRHGIRVGVSSTPTAITWDSVPLLTRLLCSIDEGGRKVEYHHLIMALDQGAYLDNIDRQKLRAADFVEVLERCVEEAHQGKKEFGSVLKIANEKIFDACAGNGPKKDLCGSGYTILGVDPEGNLKSCAATIHDPRFNLGNLLDESGRYVPGRLENLWRRGKSVQWVREFTIAKRDDNQDLRYFHGGGCWYNMSDPEAEFSASHGFAEAYEEYMRRSILKAALRGVGKEKDSPVPGVLSHQHRSRIACAGSRKTQDESEFGLDLGYCICFA